MKNISDKFLAVLYQLLLDNYGRLLPNQFYYDDPIPKNSAAFKLYISLIEVYVYTLRKIEKRGRTFGQMLQKRRLRSILRIAYTTKWWQRYFERHDINWKGEDAMKILERIPPVTRFDFIDVPKEEFLTCRPGDKKVVWRRSGGSTTGTPFEWGLNKTLLIINVLSQFIKQFEQAGFSLKYAGRNDFYIEFNWPHKSFRSEFKWFSAGDFFMRTDDEDRIGKIQAVANTISNLKNCVVRASPSDLSLLVGEMREHGFRPKVSFCSITGQLLGDGIRQSAADYFGCKNIVHYGAQEMGPLTLECADNPGYYHIFSERVIVEVLNDDCKQTPAGKEGSITVTVLDNTVMPLIRYQPGDIGALHYEVMCRCDNKSPLLEMKSRSTDIVEFSNGEKKSAIPLLRRFSREPFVSSVRRFQVRQEALDEVKILLETRKPLPEGTIDDLKKRITARYDGLLKVTIEEVSSIHHDGQKFKVFVPLRK